MNESKNKFMTTKCNVCTAISCCLFPTPCKWSWLVSSFRVFFIWYLHTWF